MAGERTANEAVAAALHFPRLDLIPATRDLAGAEIELEVAYRSRGLESWHYLFGEDVNRVKNFKLTMNTDFDRVDFPPGTMSPTSKEATAASGWRLVWESGNLISRLHVGMEMPRRLNPGPLAAKISFFAS